jgi:hypothetical protein
MNKLFLLYGNDQESINIRTGEILKETFGHAGQINAEEISLEKNKDVEQFLARTVNLNIFSQNTFLIIKIKFKRNQNFIQNQLILQIKPAYYLA